MGRIVTGLILGAGWLLLLFVGNYLLFSLVIIAVGGLALYEFLRMNSPLVGKKYIPFIVIVGLFPLLGVSLWGSWALNTSLFLAFMVMAFLTVALFSSQDNSLEFIARVWLGIFYIGFCSAHLILLRGMPQGVYWLLILTIVTASSDTGAYYVGKAIGKTKLYPALSPGKTREGAVGGILGGIIGGVIAAALLFDWANLPMIALLSMFLSMVGILGDLLESLIKRVSGVKDSGNILPGHGGILDRCDSLLLTAPTLFYILLWGHAALVK